MTLIDDLRARRTELRTTADEIITRAADEARDLTTDEFRAHADGLGQLREIEDRIEQVRDDEVRELRAAAARPALGTGQDQAGELLMRAISEASGIGAAATPPEYAASFWDRLVPASVLLQSGVQVVTTTRDSLVLPRITSDPTAAWTAEGGTITASDPGADTVTATPRKLAALVRAGNESLADSSPSIGEMLNRQMARTLGLSFDLGAFEGSGTAPAIRGLKNVSGIQSLSAGTNGAALADLDLIADALGLLDAANAAGGAIVMPPRTWAKLAKIKEESGSVVPLLNGAAGNVQSGVRRSLFGVPVWLSGQLSVAETQGSSSLASSIYVYDPSQVVVVKRQDVAIEVDRSVYFASDETAIRAIMRADLVVPNPTAVVRIAGVL